MSSDGASARRQWAAVVLLTLCAPPLGCDRRGGDHGATSSGSVRRPAKGTARGPSLHNPRWPASFSVTGKQVEPAGRLPQLSKRLGGEIAALTHYFLSAGDTRVSVNVILAADEAAAQRVHGTLLRGGGDARHRVARQGRFVVEIVGHDGRQWHRFKKALGLLDHRPRRYRVTARFGLVLSGDAGLINRLFNLLLRPQPDSAQWTAGLQQLRSTLIFGTTLALRRAPTAAGAAKYSSTPKPTGQGHSGARVVFTFGKVPSLHGIPYVDVVAEVPTVGWRPSGKATAPGPELTAATPAWPAGDPEIRARAAELTAGKTPPWDKLVALHGWVNQTIKYGGPQGARIGTLAVLKRRVGRCWDLSDLLVTLARAAGLPARQVAGWLASGPGHIWAEVYLPGTGWLGVDATAPWVGVSGDYIPLMITTDGHMPLLHLRQPKIERLE